MKQKMKLLIAALLGTAIGAVVLITHPGWVTPKHILDVTAFILFGVSVIYVSPIAGTPPTAAQAFFTNSLVTRVFLADSETTTTVTHNWNLSTTQLAAFYPFIFFYAQNSGTAAPTLGFTLTDSCTVTIAKGTVAGTGGTFVVTMLRPMSTTT